MHHPTDRITHTTAFVALVVEHCLERSTIHAIQKIALGWVVFFFCFFLQKSLTEETWHWKQNLTAHNCLSFTLRILCQAGKTSLNQMFNYEKIYRQEDILHLEEKKKKKKKKEGKKQKIIIIWYRIVMQFL